MTADPLDDRLRALLQRAVAESPVAPDPAEVELVGAALAAAPTVQPSRPRRLLAIGIAAALLLVVGLAVVLRPGDGPERGQRVASAPPVPGQRFVATDLPAGYGLLSWDDTPASDDGRTSLGFVPTPLPRPAVQAFRRAADGVEVRVAIDVFPGLDVPVAPATDEGDLAWLRKAFAGQDQVPPEEGSTLPAVTVAGAAALQEDYPVVDDPAGRPGSDLYLRNGRAVSIVSVFGATGEAAVAVLDGFTRTADGGVAPPQGGGFVAVGALPAAPAGEVPSQTRIAYGGSGAEVVTVVSLELRSEASDLLLVSAHGGGSRERWGDRDVLVRRRGALAQANLVAGGSIVGVLGPVDAVRTVVGGLRGLDGEGWAAFVAADAVRVAGLPAGRSAVVGDVRIEERWSGTDDDPGPVQGSCLVVGDTTACRPKVGSGVFDRRDLATGELVASVLVDGHWWIYGREELPGGSTPSPTSATDDEAQATARLVVDGVEQADVAQVDVDGTTWVAARLPDGAASATVVAEVGGETTLLSVERRPAA